MGARCVLLATALLILAPAAAADELARTQRRAALLLVKVLSYDYTLASRCRGSLRIGVLYRSDLAPSVAGAHAMHTAFSRLGEEGLTVQRLAIRASLIPFQRPAEAVDRARRAGVNALYLAPGVPGDAIPALLALARAGRWSTLATEAAHVRLGVAVGAVQEERAFRILINSRAAALEGSKLSAEIFKVARIVQERP